MLETDEVDDDFFTPVAGTSLANIFGNLSKNTDVKSNDSLKYVPPKPQMLPPKPKQEQTKATECIFACALIGHEWCNNVYTSRGKLGFAIIKIQKTGDYNIVLYDSTKTTLSCTTVSTDLEIIIKNNTYISFYDNLNKYWSVYGSEDEVKKIADYLINFEVNIKYSTYSEQGPPEPTNDTKKNLTLGQIDKNDKGSDTDSSINRKTKASILNRMANMGHSVLPIRALPTERTSDSSDTMEIETQPKSIRHKPMKGVIKRSNMENILPESQNLADSHQRIVASKTEPVDNVAVFTSHSGQLLPLTSPSNELSMFMSEQRISNSELRINMNRITDKVDLVLDKIKISEQKMNSNVQTDIVMKLLAEYENKIKVYEELIQSRGDKKYTENEPIIPKNTNEIEMLKNQISELEKINQNKCTEVSSLLEEIRLLNDKYAAEKLNQINNEEELLRKIGSLEINIQTKDEELANKSGNTNNYSIEEKVKNIMNDTFQTISVNFDNNKDYSGETVKKIIATVIKKITIQTLSEL